MNFLRYNNIVYKTPHVDSVQLAFATMSVYLVLYTAIFVFWQVANTGCLSFRDVACYLALGPYTMQGVPSATNLTPCTAGYRVHWFFRPKLNVHQVGCTHSSHLVLALSHYPHLVVHHHLNHSILRGMCAHSTFYGHVCQHALPQPLVCCLGPELGLHQILCLHL